MALVKEAAIFDPSQPDLPLGNIGLPCNETTTEAQLSLGIQEMPPLPSGLIATIMMALIGATAVLGFISLTGWKPKDLR